MIHGLDTGFLVAAEVREHAEHAAARDTLAQFLSVGDLVAIAPQVLAEFIHAVTDPRRFAQPLDMNAARGLAEQWWTASDVVQAFPDAGAVRQFLAWLQQFSFGRKRLLDTMLAATLPAGGHPIAAHDQQGRLPDLRRLHLHHADRKQHESLNGLEGYAGAVKSWP
jgi:predicted nucleic acid-binding protein